MKIVLIRHFEVNFRWKFCYSSAEFQNACAAYDIAPIKDNGLRRYPDSKIITSTLSRSVETAKLIFGKNPDEQNALLCEVPISAFLQSRFKMPTILWNVVGRFLWRLNSGNQPETYRESQTRVNQCIDRIVVQNESCFIVCHGWIIKLIIKRLLQSGFQGPQPIFIKSGKALAYIKD